MGQVAMVFLVPILATILLACCSAGVDQPVFYLYPQPVAEHNHPHPVAYKTHPQPVVDYNHPRPVADNNHPQPVAYKAHPQPLADYNHPQPVADYNHPQPVADNNHPQSVADYNYPQPVADYNHPQPLQSYRTPWYYPYAPRYGFPVFAEPTQQKINPSSPEGKKGGFVIQTVYLTPADKGYTYVKTMGWYKVYPTPVTFAAAKAICEADNARMILIDSQSEADEMVRLMGLKSVARGWVGLTDAATEGTFLTIFGDPIESTYEVWAPGDPNNAADWDCVYMDTNAAAMVVYDCVLNPSAAVCEI